MRIIYRVPGVRPTTLRQDAGVREDYQQINPQSARLLRRDKEAVRHWNADLR